VFGGQAYETEKFDTLTSDNRSREVKVAVTNSISGSLVQQVAGIGIAIIIWVASLHGNEISAGGFAAMLTAMVTILKPMKNLSNISSSIQKGIAAAESIFEILDMPNEKDTGTQTIHTQEIQIDFEHVSFYYPGSQKKILDDINFSMPAGKTTAIIGRSGAGKSTLTKLIPHFYDQYEGKILLDHKELHDIQLQNLRAQIALVSQHIVLFNDTIANNIAYGILANTSREQIINAAKAAFAHDFIMALPEQYDTVVGDKGNLLSGGQRQRLAIARAILKNAPILILDEATSALDSESELYIQKALDDLTQNRTTMVIAHRLSTIEKADQIIVMDEGRVVERGTHSDLLKKDGAYAKLYHVQFKH